MFIMGVGLDFAIFIPARRPRWFGLFSWSLKNVLLLLFSCYQTKLQYLVTEHPSQLKASTFLNAPVLVCFVVVCFNLSRCFFTAVLALWFLFSYSCYILLICFVNYFSAVLLLSLYYHLWITVQWSYRTQSHSVRHTYFIYLTSLAFPFPLKIFVSSKFNTLIFLAAASSHNHLVEHNIVCVCVCVHSHRETDTQVYSVFFPISQRAYWSNWSFPLCV